MMLKVEMAVEATNQAIRNGEFQKTIMPLIDQLKPEGCYFTTDNGKRTAFIYFEMADLSQIPAIAEPFFQLLNAELDFRPVMNRDDLAKGLGNTNFKKAA